MVYKETGRCIKEKQSKTIVKIDENENKEQNYKTIMIVIIVIIIRVARTIIKSRRNVCTRRRKR